MAQIKLNTIQIVHMPHYEKLLIQIVNMAHICENDMIQIKDMFQIVATWLQLSTEEYVEIWEMSFDHACYFHLLFIYVLFLPH